MCVLWFGARLVVDGKLTAGELSAFVVYAIFVSGNVGALAGVFSSLIQARRLVEGSCPATPRHDGLSHVKNLHLQLDSDGRCLDLCRPKAYGIAS